MMTCRGVWVYVHRRRPAQTQTQTQARTVAMEIGSSVRASAHRGEAFEFVEGIVLQVTSSAVSILDRDSGDTPNIHKLSVGDWKVVPAVFAIPAATVALCRRLGCILAGGDDRHARATPGGGDDDPVHYSNPAPRLRVIDVDTLPLMSLVTFPACTPHDTVAMAICRPSVGGLCVDDEGVRSEGCTFSRDDADASKMCVAARAAPMTGCTNSALWWPSTHPLVAASSTIVLDGDVAVTLTTLGAVLEKAVLLGTGAVVTVCETKTSISGGVGVIQFVSTITSTHSPAIGGGTLRYIMLPKSVVRVLARDVMLTVDDVRCRQVYEMAADTGNLHACLERDVAFAEACAATSSAVVAMATQDGPRMPVEVVANGWEHPHAAGALAHHLSDAIKTV